MTYKTFIYIDAGQGETIQFPEDYTTWNRACWFFINLLTSIKVEWVK